MALFKKTNQSLENDLADEGRFMVGLFDFAGELRSFETALGGSHGAATAQT